MMKNLILVALVSFCLSAFGDEVKFGTREAAQQVASNMIGLLYNVPSKQIVVGMPVVEGSIATTTAIFPGKICTITLARNETANRMGWVVNQYDCKNAS